ncbi:MAG: hypothetical protein AOA65_2152 [Candidatus Bathyarchaeota archaeon BA1]|nr:MAG: hypothetical protein AOA65_2152 [Candidatus Bathyarchaeota archaeon BA1]
MIRKRFRLVGGRMVTLEDLREQDLPEVVQVLNSVIREGIFISMDEEITDMEMERKWYHDHMKAGMTYLVARVDGLPAQCLFRCLATLRRYGCERALQTILER